MNRAEQIQSLARRTTDLQLYLQFRRKMPMGEAIRKTQTWFEKKLEQVKKP